jgi:hypothetical protein
VVYPGTLFHRRHPATPMHSYENRSEIRALIFYGAGLAAGRYCHYVQISTERAHRHIRPSLLLSTFG